MNRRSHPIPSGAQRAARRASVRPVATGRAIAALVLAAGMLPLLAQAQDAPQGDLKRAEGKVAMCIGCHGIPGYKASFPEVYRVPYLGGQSAKYLESALVAYRKGDRSHPSMRAIARGLTDEDIADLSAYYARSAKDK